MFFYKNKIFYNKQSGKIIKYQLCSVEPKLKKLNSLRKCELKMIIHHFLKLLRKFCDYF